MDSHGVATEIARQACEGGTMNITRASEIIRANLGDLIDDYLDFVGVGMDRVVVDQRLRELEDRLARARFDAGLSKRA